MAKYGFTGAKPTQSSSANTGVFGVNDVVELLNNSKYSLQGERFEALVIAGGGGGTGAFSGGSGNYGGGGGAGGYRNSYSAENSGGNQPTEKKVRVPLGENITVSVGAGGTGGGNNVGAGGQFDGFMGSTSTFGDVTASRGGGGIYTKEGWRSPVAGAVASAGGTLKSTTTYPTDVQFLDTPIQGHLGSAGNGSNAGGGGGGAGSAGTLATGGSGLSSLISGSALTKSVGGNDGPNSTNSGTNAPANTGNGGQGASYFSSGYGSRQGGNGGSGIVYIRYPNTFTITVGAGLTYTTTTDGSDKVTTFTAGTGTVSFS